MYISIPHTIHNAQHSVPMINQLQPQTLRESLPETQYILFQYSEGACIPLDWISFGNYFWKHLNMQEKFQMKITLTINTCSACKKIYICSISINPFLQLGHLCTYICFLSKHSPHSSFFLFGYQVNLISDYILSGRSNYEISKSQHQYYL